MTGTGKGTKWKVVLCRKFHAGLRQRQGPGPIVPYCASPVPRTGPGPVHVCISHKSAFMSYNENIKRRKLFQENHCDFRRPFQEQFSSKRRWRNFALHYNPSTFFQQSRTLHQYLRNFMWEEHSKGLSSFFILILSSKIPKFLIDKVKVCSFLFPHFQSSPRIFFSSSLGVLSLFSSITL